MTSIYDKNYRTLNNVQIPTFDTTVTSVTDTVETTEPTLERIDSYMQNKNTFMMETLNRNVELYKLMHNEMVYSNELQRKMTADLLDIIDNLVELNDKINSIEKKLGDIVINNNEKMNIEKEKIVIDKEKKPKRISTKSDFKF